MHIFNYHRELAESSSIEIFKSIEHPNVYLFINAETKFADKKIDNFIHVKLSHEERLSALDEERVVHARELRSGDFIIVNRDLYKHRNCSLSELFTVASQFIENEVMPTENLTAEDVKKFNYGYSYEYHYMYDKYNEDEDTRSILDLMNKVQCYQFNVIPTVENIQLIIECIKLMNYAMREVRSSCHGSDEIVHYPNKYTTLPVDLAFDFQQKADYASMISDITPNVIDYVEYHNTTVTIKINGEPVNAKDFYKKLSQAIEPHRIKFSKPNIDNEQTNVNDEQDDLPF